MLLESKNTVDLKTKIEAMFSHTFNYEALAKSSQDRYSEDAYYQRLMNVYTGE